MRLLRLVSPDLPLGYVAPLGTEHAARLAAIHAMSFARAWDAHEFERLLADRGVVADGLFVGSGRADGFVLSRVALDEAEILTVALAPEARGRGYSPPAARPPPRRPARASAFAPCISRSKRATRRRSPFTARFGFAEVGRREGYYRKPDGTSAAALTMNLRL